MFVQEGVYRVTLPMPGPLETVNCYILTEGDEAYLVDAALGADGGWESLLAGFERAGVDPRRLSGIILTHAHPDHLGYLATLGRLTDAPVLLHEGEQHTLATRFGEQPGYHGLLVDWFSRHGLPASMASEIADSGPKWPRPALDRPRWLAGGEVIAVGSMRWEVLWTPGHAPGHICLFERRRGLLITGDHLLPHETPNVSVRPNLPSNPLGSYLDSLRLVQFLPAQQGLPGHGPLFGDVSALAAQMIGHHDVRFGDALRALRDGPRHAFDVACAIPWLQRSKRFLQLSPHDRYLAIGETISHLECLEGLGRVERLALGSSTLWKLSNEC